MAHQRPRPHTHKASRSPQLLGGFGAALLLCASPAWGHVGWEAPESGAHLLAGSEVELRWVDTIPHSTNGYLLEFIGPSREKVIEYVQASEHSLLWTVPNGACDECSLVVTQVNDGNDYTATLPIQILEALAEGIEPASVAEMDNSEGSETTDTQEPSAEPPEPDAVEQSPVTEPAAANPEMAGTIEDGTANAGSTEWMAPSAPDEGNAADEGNAPDGTSASRDVQPSGEPSASERVENLPAATPTPEMPGAALAEAPDATEAPDSMSAEHSGCALTPGTPTNPTSVPQALGVVALGLALLRRNSVRATRGRSTAG